MREREERRGEMSGGRTEREEGERKQGNERAEHSGGLRVEEMEK